MSIEQGKYENLKYFIESYFNWSMDYADLDKLMDEFEERELPFQVDGLCQEIKEIDELRNWEEIKKIIYLHGRRNLTIKKVEQMIELFMIKLSNH
ncbi:hypothetical protein BBD42_03895 [Paenibacillus sp. BIHB 4019]|uniref:CdiI immunity protein domain-containing protein n=1 Tax=Paenibacillus sp. BIHB 4019 TaxID=1870819 RepID=A0A1B2DDC1_9BACL|nr:hypothetical protein [Paenibacillus sp. BIHB 4019]ANY65699.1 hypothetical protein BBD42_03895 [Paenibacillus sp. BIHB 4019]